MLIKDFSGYNLVILGGDSVLDVNQENLIMDIIMLANDYERLKAFIG